MSHDIPSQPQSPSADLPSWAPKWLVRFLDGGPDEDASPRRDIAKGLLAIGVFFLVFLGWGLTAQLDAGVYAPGSVVVFGNRQSIQHRDGGIVSELDVHEGDRVKAGQVLLRLAQTELAANTRATADQVIENEAMQARLLAEANGATVITPPADFAGMTGDDRDSAVRAMQIQQREFAARATDLSTQKAVLRLRMAQLSEEIEGYHRQVDANGQQRQLIGQETRSLKELLDRGLVPMTRVRGLERDDAQLAGQAGEYNADIARVQQQIGETRLQIAALDSQRLADVSKDYATVQMQLSDARPKLAALREQMERAILRAPVSGHVLGLAVFTVGGVVGPGQKLMDIVPDDEPLVILARIKPDDASDLKVGQSTEIRIPAFHDRRMPVLHGLVATVSADSLTDDKTGAAYYLARIDVPPSELRVISDVRGADSGLKPGLPVEVVVPVRKRSALDYLTDPLRNLFWRSFHES